MQRSGQHIEIIWEHDGSADDEGAIRKAIVLILESPLWKTTLDASASPIKNDGNGTDPSAPSINPPP